VVCSIDADCTGAAGKNVRVPAHKVGLYHFARYYFAHAGYNTETLVSYTKTVKKSSYTVSVSQLRIITKMCLRSQLCPRPWSRSLMTLPRPRPLGLSGEGNSHPLPFLTASLCYGRLDIQPLNLEPYRYI